MDLTTAGTVLGLAALTAGVVITAIEHRAGKKSEPEKKQESAASPATEPDDSFLKRGDKNDRKRRSGRTL